MLLATYSVWGLWLLGPPMLNQINRASGLSLQGLATERRPVLAGVCALLVAWVSGLA